MSEETGQAILSKVTAIEGHIGDMHDVAILIACLLVVCSVALVSLALRRYRS